MEFVPFVSPHMVRDYDAGTPTRTTTDVGFDFKIGLSQSFNADLTYKTDFAHVEADQEVVNLSRFSLFFPEKRQFFTEGAGTFDYSQNAGANAGPGLLTLFYSRRVGLQDGREVPILCLLYTSDAADERSSVDLGGRRIFKKTTKQKLRAHAK